MHIPVAAYHTIQPTATGECTNEHSLIAPRISIIHVITPHPPTFRQSPRLFRIPFRFPPRRVRLPSPTNVRRPTNVRVPRVPGTRRTIKSRLLQRVPLAFSVPFPRYFPGIIASRLFRRAAWVAVAVVWCWRGRSRVTGWACWSVSVVHLWSRGQEGGRIKCITVLDTLIKGFDRGRVIEANELT